MLPFFPVLRFLNGFFVIASVYANTEFTKFRNFMGEKDKRDSLKEQGPDSLITIIQFSRPQQKKGQRSYLRIGSLSTRVFETRTATRSELFSLLTCLHTTTFMFTLLSTFSLLGMISIKIWETPLSWQAKCFLPVDACVSKTRVL